MDVIQTMINLQKNLLDHYIRIEGLPFYPIDLQSKSGQKLIKDFIYRCIEELGEANETYMKLCENLATNGDEHEASKLAAEFFEELADFYHFLMEIFIYSGLEGPFFTHCIEEMTGEHLFGESTLNMFILIGNHENNQDNVFFNPKDCFKASAEIGGRIREIYVSSTLVELHTRFLWRITFHLVKAGNCLKNKAWSQEEKQSNILAYQLHLSNVMIALGGYFSLLSMKEGQVLCDYQLKNAINQKRIADGY